MNISEVSCYMKLKLWENALYEGGYTFRGAYLNRFDIQLHFGWNAPLDRGRGRRVTVP